MEKAISKFEKHRLLLQNSKQLVEEHEAKFVLLKKMNENLMKLVLCHTYDNWKKKF